MQNIIRYKHIQIIRKIQRKQSKCTQNLCDPQTLSIAALYQLGHFTV